MNDESVTVAKLGEASNDPVRAEAIEEAPHADKPPISPRSSPPLPASNQLNGIAHELNGNANNDKSDSEAETVVLSGKDEGVTDDTRKAIKHEDVRDAGQPITTKPDEYQRYSDDVDEVNKDAGRRKPTLKRKRAIPESAAGEVQEGGNSSNLSSTVSSPAHEAKSSGKSGSDSDRSRSSPPYDEVAQPKEKRLRKRRLRDTSEDHGRKRRGKSDPSSVNIDGKGSRGTRSATHFEASSNRSESPPLRRQHRAQSSQSTDLQGVPKRRRAPPPRLADGRRKISEDVHGESDDSSSVHSHPHLQQKFVSAEYNAISSAKMSHKKNRDKNGRTILARTCANDDVETAELRLKERPQDIDIADNAGNTPLQIAALEGHVEIVKMLLDAGCDKTCKNIDMEGPLIDAVDNGHLEVVKLLLGAGFDPRQGNAEGVEPLELVKEEKEHYEEIRAALIEAKGKDTMRRHSEDHSWQQQVGSRDNDASSVGASAASPTDAGNRSPTNGPGPRRRTARSQPTRDGLLWVNPTPEKLREAAGRGDMSVVDHILKMRPKADTEAILAAARGGHDFVLEIMIAIARPESDPDPLRSDNYKPAFSTPMLAAIGRGNLEVIKLLLSQPGFDPTRRLYKGLTYYELAKERQGSNWQEEYEILKEAFDNYNGHGAKKTSENSPRKKRTKNPGPTTDSPHRSSSPLAQGKGPSPNGKHHDVQDEIRDEAITKAASHKRLRVKEVDNDDASSVLSDRDSESLGPPKSKVKGARSVSDAGFALSKNTDPSKPRRKLLSRNDLKSDQDTTRRASLQVDAHSRPLVGDVPRRKSSDGSVSNKDHRKRRTSDASVSNRDHSKRKSSDGSVSGKDHHRHRANDEAIPLANIEEQHSRDRSHMHGPRKKRPRTSTSPQISHSDLNKNSDVVKKKKKRRVDSEGNAIAQEPEQPPRPGPAMVANMIATPAPMTTSGNPLGAAPVAFMGSSMTSPVGISPTRSPTQLNDSPTPSIDQALQQDIYQQALQQQRQANDDLLRQQRLEQEREREQLRQEEEEQARNDAKLREKVEAEKAEKEKVEQAAREESERLARIAREEEEARQEMQRQADEAERQLRIEREEEEARVARKKRDEELQRKRAEQERLRKEEQERRRAEHEERERLRRIRIQEEQERERRESLPNGLKRAAELSPEEARGTKEIVKWLPLHTVTTRELDPDCDDQVSEERWIANVQVAPILAITDLDLSQCESPLILVMCLIISFTGICNPSLPMLSNPQTDTAWPRLPLTTSQRTSLWRQCRNQMSQSVRSALAVTWPDAYSLDNETKPKFFDERLRIFWVKLGDFMDIVPRKAHLEGLRMITRAMTLHGEGVPQAHKAPNGLAGGDGTARLTSGGVNGEMVNGHR